MKTLFKSMQLLLRRTDQHWLFGAEKGNTPGALIVGVNGSYVYKGEFDPTQDTPDDDLDPGDQLLVNALFNWQPYDRLTLDASVVYSHFAADMVDGQESFQEGDKLTIGSTFSFQYSTELGFTLNLQESLQGKNKEWSEDGLETESENSNGHEFSGGLNVSYNYSEKLAFRAQGNLRYYAESDRADPGSGLPYSGKRVRYAAGGGIAYEINKYLVLSGTAKYFIMNQDQDFKHEEDTTYQGVNLDVGMTCMF